MIVCLTVLPLALLPSSRPKLNGSSLLADMWPRRSTVLRYSLGFFCLASVILLLMPSHEHAAHRPFWRHLLFEMKSVNESELRREMMYLRAKVNSTDSIENKTLEQMYEYVQEMKRQLPVNPHDFHYIINPSSICEDQDVFLLIYVHSAPSHYKRRTAIRETWGNTKNFPHFTLHVVFLVGKPDERTVQEALYMESDMYGDIVQENFHDSYRNLTYKAILGLKWTTAHCKQARFVLKTDDDIFVNIFNVVHQLESTLKHEPNVRSFLMCLVWYRMKVVRDVKSKWYLSRKEFPDDYFPTYCSGSAFILTTDVIEAMYEASFKVPFFWVDDYFVTGLLAQKVGVKHRKLNSAYSLGPSTFYDKFTEEGKWQSLTFGHVHNLNQMNLVWRQVLRDQDKIKKLMTTPKPTQPQA